MTQPRVIALLGNVPLLGQERANIETVHALHEMGCAVLFLIRGEHTGETIQKELRRRGLDFIPVPFYDTLRHGVPLRIWLKNAVNILRGSWRLWRIARKFGATHIHAGSTANVLNFLPALAVMRQPLVFRAGDLPPLHHALWRAAWRFVTWRAAAIVCDSRFLQGQLVALGAQASRTRVIYAPPPRRASAARHADAAAGQHSGKSIVYVGQISEGKGVHLLVDAALRICRRNPAARFVIAGDHSWNNPFAAALIDKVRAAGMSSRIAFPGFVEDIAALYSDATLHVCPSLVPEGYGLTVIEAKQHGVPSIVFPSGALPELVTSGVDGQVCASCSADELERAIQHCLNAPELLEPQARAAAASLHTLGVQEFAHRWSAVYAEVRQENHDKAPNL
jgi:glycosyltransferase involved in cell wall biosynthesis